MAHMIQADINRIVAEIKMDDEKQRRSSMSRRGRIYKDGGKDYLIDHIEAEFGFQAVREMRLAPVNILKAVINRQSMVYKSPPIRTSKTNQDLVDEYTSIMMLNSEMAKANRYYNLYANCQLYILPSEPFGPRHPVMKVVPPDLYSVDANDIDRTKMEVLIFSNFTERDQGKTRTETTSTQAIRGTMGSRASGREIESKQAEEFDKTPYIFWSDDFHFTTNNEGSIFVDPENPEGLNPIGMIPSVNLAKDRDNQFWAMQGEDLVDMSIALQLGYTDLLSIAKMQGFSVLTVASEEQPQRLDIGLNKVVWLKQRQDGPTPSMDYVQASSPINEYKELLSQLQDLTLATNDLSGANLKGDNSSATSGQQVLLENMDLLAAVEMQKPVFRSAEEQMWERIAAWHNLLLDKKELPPHLSAMGKFADDFEVSVIYKDIKPLESDEQRIKQARELLDLGLATKADAMKTLHPELTDDEIQDKLKEIEDEKKANAERFGLNGKKGPVQVQPVSDIGGEPEGDDKDIDKPGIQKDR